MIDPLPRLKEQSIQGSLARPALVEAVIAVRCAVIDEMFEMDDHLATASDAGTARTNWMCTESSIPHPQQAVDLVM